MSERSYDQRCVIKSCFKLGYSATETLTKIKETYGDAALSRSQVFKWFTAFSEGRESVKDEPRSGRPSTSRNEENEERIQKLLRADRRLTVRKIAEQLHLNHTTTHQLLTNVLGKEKVKASFEKSLIILVTNLAFTVHSVHNFIYFYHVTLWANYNQPSGKVQVTTFYIDCPISPLSQLFHQSSPFSL